MSVAQSVYFVNNLLSTLYVDPTGASNWEVTAIADQIALEQMTKSASVHHSPTVDAHVLASD